MTYQECKQNLYNLEIMADIPDKWKEEVPFLVEEENGTKYIAFLYCIPKNGVTKIAGLILISVDNLDVQVYSTEEIEGRFGASSQYCQALDIQNYTEYFIRKEQYEQLFAKYVNAKGNISGEEKVLLKKLFLSMFSKEQYNKVISYLGNSYINQLNS